MPPLASQLAEQRPDLVASPVCPLAAAAMAGLLSAVLATAAAPPRRAQADELPKDTNTIESLTVEQAQKLVKEFPGVDVHVTFKSSRHTFRKSLPLNGLKTLDAATARALSHYHGPLILSGLTTLDSDVLEAFNDQGANGNWSSSGGGRGEWLRSYEGSVLHVDGLMTLDAKTARALMGVWRRQWSGILPNLERLDIDTAKVLAGFNGDLILNGLTTLDADAAKVLVTGNCMFLGLDGLTTLDADTAKALAEFKGHFLSLGGLTKLDADTAKVLAESNRSLGLNGLTTLDADTAEALVDSKCEGLLLDGLTTLDAETATVIAGFKGRHVSLSGLTSLDAETAKTLAGFKGQLLQLNGLTTLDADTAQALAELRGRINVGESLFMKNPLTPEAALACAMLSNGQLNTVTAFESPDSVDVARALAARKGPLSLPNLRKISPKTLAALIEKEDIDIPPIENLELILEPDGSATEDFVIPDGFQLRQRREAQRREAQGR